jgi:putative transposase
MSDRFKNKYRIESTRLKNWNYGWNAAYFITICTLDRTCFFGDITDQKMILNDIGLIARDCWLQIPKHFPFVKLGVHVVMPNHIHGIVVIDKPIDGRDDDRNNDPIMGTENPCGNHTSVETQNFASLPPLSSQPDSSFKNKFGPQSQNLASIIRGYKIGVTKNARIINPNFAWQPRYHDHIIRNEKSFYRISEYIKNNPSNWAKDKFR